MLRRPVEAAHVLGKLLVALGPERIVWGTDCAWYGSPQPLIDAFRTFVIPESMQERYGYPALTAETKERILSTNAQALYGVTAGPRVDGAWAANAGVELQRAVTAAELAPEGPG
jgi:predicted TIM-barrel fold metal-dependent hydrolase